MRDQVHQFAHTVRCVSSLVLTRAVKQPPLERRWLPVRLPRRLLLKGNELMWFRPEDLKTSEALFVLTSFHHKRVCGEEEEDVWVEVKVDKTPLKPGLLVRTFPSGDCEAFVEGWEPHLPPSPQLPDLDSLILGGRTKI